MTQPCDRCGLEIADEDAWPVGLAWKCLDRGPCYERMLVNTRVAVGLTLCGPNQENQWPLSA